MARIQRPTAPLNAGPISRRSVDQVLSERSAPSPAGNTFWKTMRRCPREHALQHLAKLQPLERDDEALTVGLLFHRALEYYYRALMENDGEEPEAAAWHSIAAFADEPGYEDTYPEVERMLAGYLQLYREQDQSWQILAVEETLSYHEAPGHAARTQTERLASKAEAQLDSAVRYTARLDLVVVDEGRTWLVEHKTARSISADLRDGYQLDQQILGQVWLYRQCVDQDAYPPLAGVLVNITTKHKPPRCERIQVCPSPAHLAAFERSFRAWAAMESVFAELGWPKALGNCHGSARFFRRCPYFDICHGQPSASVEELSRLEAPMGFCRPTDERSE